MNYIIGTKEQCELYNAHVTELKKYNGVTMKWAEARKHPTEEVWSIVEEPSIPVYDESELLIEGLQGVEVIERLPEDWTADELELI